MCYHIVQFLGIKSLGIIDGKVSMTVSLQPPNVVEHFALVGKLNIEVTVIKDVTTRLQMNEAAVVSAKIRRWLSFVFVLTASKEPKTTVEINYGIISVMICGIRLILYLQNFGSGVS